MVLQDGVNFLAGRFSQQMRLVQAPDARQTPPSEPSALWTGSKWATAAMHAKSQDKENSHFLACRRASHSRFECASLLVTVQVFVLPLLSACLLSFYILFFALFHLNFLWCVCPPSFSCCQLFLSISISYSSFSLSIAVFFPPPVHFIIFSSVRLVYMSWVVHAHQDTLISTSFLSFFFIHSFILQLVNIVIVLLLLLAFKIIVINTYCTLIIVYNYTCNQS